MSQHTDDLVHFAAWKNAVGIFADAPDFDRQALVYHHPSGTHRCFVYGDSTFTCLTAAVVGVLETVGLPTSTELVLPMCVREVELAGALVARIKLHMFALTHPAEEIPLCSL